MSITLPPLPNRSCIVTYMGDGRGLHYTLGVAAGTALIEQPPGSQLDLYTADQMHAHAAAVSAAKDKEIERLREDADVDASIILACGHASLDRDKVIAALRAEVAGLLELVVDAAYTLEKARIWDGMGWTYNPLHPIQYMPMRKRLHDECNRIYTELAALAARKGEA